MLATRNARGALSSQWIAVGIYLALALPALLSVGAMYVMAALVVGIDVARRPGGLTRRGLTGEALAFVLTFGLVALTASG